MCHSVPVTAACLLLLLSLTSALIPQQPPLPQLIHHHQYYRPEPDFSPLMGYHLSPSKALPAPPSLHNFNYLYGNPSNYFSSSAPVLSYQPQPQAPSYMIPSPASTHQPAYSYTGALGNLGSLSLSSPVLSNYGSSYSYVYPSNYQSFLYDPYQPQQQKPLPGPPFGYIEKQSRNPLDNPAHFVKMAPPKAVMTTATDLLGLKEDHYYGDHGESQDKLLHHYQHQQQPQLQQRRKPTNLSFNHFYNTENNEFTYTGSQQQGGKQSTSKNSKKGLVTQLKVLNGTEIEVEAATINKHVSEPVLPPSILSLSTRWNDKEYDNFVNLEQPRNIARGKKNREAAIEHQVEDTLEEEEQDSQVILQVDSLMDEGSATKKIKSYHCPRTEDAFGDEPEVYADPVKCDQFYYCKSGKPYVFKCPVNRYFNPYAKACELDTDFACALTLRKK